MFLDEIMNLYSKTSPIANEEGFEGSYLILNLSDVLANECRIIFDYRILFHIHSSIYLADLSLGALKTPFIH